MSQRSILVVDDELINRQIIKEIFSPNYQVLEAVDGDEALQMVNLHYNEISFILLDIVMPNRDGVSVLEEFHNDPRYYHFPVIIVSSLKDKRIIKRTKKLGASAYFVKPVAVEEIYQFVNKTIR